MCSEHCCYDTHQDVHQETAVHCDIIAMLARCLMFESMGERDFVAELGMVR